jgi:hypothetical protein
MSDTVKKILQCCCLTSTAYNAAMCIDSWHSIEACGLAYLYCDACWWTLFSPICIDLKIGECGKAMDNCLKGVKYCLFGCALNCVGCIDGCYNCVMVIKTICDSGIKGYADITKNTQFLHDKIKSALGL